MHPVTHNIGTRYRVAGQHWQNGYHTGIDFRCPVGTKVKAAIPGRVIHAGTGGWGRAYGIHVIVEGRVNGKAVRVLYAHLSTVQGYAHPGQDVAAGEVLGRSGNTGNTTGPHLHLEVRRAPFRYGDDIDPGPVLAWQPETHVSRGVELLDQAIAELAKAGSKRWRVRAGIKAAKAVRKSLPTR